MENNDHSNSHNNHVEEEGQTYPKGWWVPKIGLLIVALGFTAIGTFVFSASGTDRWGKTEQCEMKDGKCCGDEKCKDGKDAESCKDKGACDKDKASETGK